MRATVARMGLIITLVVLLILGSLIMWAVQRLPLGEARPWVTVIAVLVLVLVVLGLLFGGLPAGDFRWD